MEVERACDFRKIGGLYLRGIGIAVGCDRLPFLLDYCPVCGSGIKFTRGFQWICWYDFAGSHNEVLSKPKPVYDVDVVVKCKCKEFCPICYPKEFDILTDDDGNETKEKRKYGVMWVGEAHYNPDSFIAEAEKYGICKRIAGIPKNICFGVTWVLLAHKKAIDGEKPAVFYAFRPSHVEKIVSIDQASDDKYIDGIQKRGIIVLVADKVDEKANVLQVIHVDEFRRKMLLAEEQKKKKGFLRKIFTR